MTHVQETAQYGMAWDTWEATGVQALDGALDLWQIELGDTDVWCEDQRYNGDMLDLLSDRLSANSPEQCIPDAVIPELDSLWFDPGGDISTLKDVSGADIESVLESVVSVNVGEKESILNGLLQGSLSSSPETEQPQWMLLEGGAVELDEAPVDILDLLGFTMDDAKSRCCNVEDNSSVLRRLLTSDLSSLEEHGSQDGDTVDVDECQYDTVALSPESCTSPESSDDEYQPPVTVRRSFSGQRGRKSKLRRVDRRSRKKEQNKTAAIRYREKKKLEQQEMEAECRLLEQTNKRLKDKVDDMMRESSYLKNLIIEIYRKPGKRSLH